MTGRLVLLPALLAALAGCNTIGTSKFDCPASLGGAACISAREVYEATHVSDRVPPNFRQGKPIDDASTPASASGSSSAAAGAAAALPAATAATRGSVQPPLPEIDSPLPIRTPAKVMRIRIFPWEDNQRDLHSGGYVFTEVEQRTWMIGEEQVSRVQANVISPLSAPGVRPGGNSLSPLQVLPAPTGPAPAVRQVPQAPMAPAVRPGTGQPAQPGFVNPPTNPR